MPEKSFKTRLKLLDFKKKLILAGAVVMAISAFLPWYRDIDRFNTGDMYLGITGPLYLAGLIVFLASVASAALLGTELFEKPKPKLPLKDTHFYLFAGALSLLMLVIASSVYFHNKFGINLTEKTMGFGLIAAYIGVALDLIGGVMIVRKIDVNFEEAGEIKPLIDLNVKERMQGTLEQKKPEMRDPAMQQSIDENTNDLRRF